MVASALGLELINKGSIADDCFYNTYEVATYLGIARNTLSTYITRGKIRACRYGQCWRIKGKDLRTFLDNMERNTSE